MSLNRSVLNKKRMLSIHNLWIVCFCLVQFSSKIVQPLFHILFSALFSMIFRSVFNPWTIMLLFYQTYHLPMVVKSTIISERNEHAIAPRVCKPWSSRKDSNEQIVWHFFLVFSPVSVTLINLQNWRTVHADDDSYCLEPKTWFRVSNHHTVIPPMGGEEKLSQEHPQ